MLTEKAKQDAASSALEGRCLQAEAEVVELKEKLTTMERRGGYHAPPATASATVGSSSQTASGGRGRGLVAQVSPQPGRMLGEPTAQAPPPRGRGMRGVDVRRLLTPPPAGRGLLGRFMLSGTGSLNPTPTPSPETGSGLGALAPGQRQAQESESAMDVDRAGNVPETSAVTSGAPSITTNQGPAYTGPHHLPQ